VELRTQEQANNMQAADPVTPVSAAFRDLAGQSAADQKRSSTLVILSVSVSSVGSCTRIIL